MELPSVNLRDIFGELMLVSNTIENAGADDQTQSDESLSNWINALIHVYKNFVFLNKKVLDAKDDVLSSTILLYLKRIQTLLNKLCRMKSERRFEKSQKVSAQIVKVSEEEPKNDFIASKERCEYDTSLKDMSAKVHSKDPRKVLINKQRIENFRNLKKHFVSLQFQYSQLVSMFIKNKRSLGLSWVTLEKMRDVGRIFLQFVKEMEKI
jgi:hypothetical protein